MGEELPPNGEQPTSLTCGATVLGMDFVVPAGARVGRNCIIYPRADADQLTNREVPSGTTVRTAYY